MENLINTLIFSIATLVLFIVNKEEVESRKSIYFITLLISIIIGLLLIEPGLYWLAAETTRNIKDPLVYKPIFFYTSYLVLYGLTIFIFKLIIHYGKNVMLLIGILCLVGYALLFANKVSLDNKSSLHN